MTWHPSRKCDKRQIAKRFFLNCQTGMRPVITFLFSYLTPTEEVHLISVQPGIVVRSYSNERIRRHWKSPSLESMDHLGIRTFAGVGYRLFTGNVQRQWHCWLLSTLYATSSTNLASLHRISSLSRRWSSFDLHVRFSLLIVADVFWTLLRFFAEAVVVKRYYLDWLISRDACVYFCAWKPMSCSCSVLLK